MLRALDEFEIGGVTTLIPFHKALLATKQWRKGETCRDLIENPKWLKSLEPEPPPEPAAEEPEAGEKVEREYTVEVDARRFSVRVIGPPPAFGGGVAANSAGGRAVPRRERAAGGPSSDGANGTILSPIQGTVLKVNVEKGAEVEAGAVVCVIEAMKMENEITAPLAGKVEELNVSEGGSVASGEVIAVIK